MRKMVETRTLGNGYSRKRLGTLDDMNRLLLFHGVEEEEGVLWRALGGGIGEDEMAEAAARRELKEQTGLADLNSRWQIEIRSTPISMTRIGCRLNTRTI
jgi:ADP-ribose pyrophosphatase YjhB (NUDIX family)